MTQNYSAAALRLRPESLPLQLVHELPTAMVQIDAKDEVIYCNESFTQLTGIAAADMIGQSPYVLLSIDLAELSLVIRRCRKYNASCQVSWPTRLHGRHEGYCQWTLMPAADDCREVWIVLESEVASREALRGARSESDRLRSTLDSVGAMVWMIDSDGLLLFCNAAWTAATGQQNPSRDAFLSVIHPDDTMQVLAARRQALIDLKPYELTMRLRDADGRFRYVSEHGVPRYDDEFDRVELIGVVHDVDALHRARLDLESTSAGAMALLDSANDATVVLDAEGRILSFSSRAEELFGAKAVDVIGQPARLFVPEELAGRYGALLSDYLRNGKSSVRVTSANGVCARSMTGHVFPASLSAAVIEGEQGRQVVLSIRDDTAIQAARAESRRTKERYELAVRASHDGIWDLDMASGRIEVSPRMAQLLGYSKQELESLGAELRGLIHEDDVDSVMAQFIEHLRGRSGFEVSCRLRHAGGLYRWVQLRGLARRNDTGRVDYVAGSMADIHDQRMMAEALRRDEEDMRRVVRKLQQLSHKLMNVQEEERGHLARELHDEIGQSLTAAIINVQTESEGSVSPEVRDRIAGELHQVLQQVRNMSLDLRPTMLDDLGLVPALEWVLSRQAQLAGFEGILNAESMPRQRFDPRVEVTCYRIVQESLTNVVRHAKASRVTVNVELINGVIRLQVEDDGAGFDADRAIQTSSQVTSFGLVGMKERAALIGGRLNIDSIIGSGTMVHASLPVSPESSGVITREF